MNKGDMIRENRQSAQAEMVMRVTENMVTTYSGNTYHITKIVRA